MSTTWWNSGGGNEFMLDAAPLDGPALTMDWTDPATVHVTFGYLFSQDRVQASKSVDPAANYWKRSSLWFRLNALGDANAPIYERAPSQAGTALSPSTETAGNIPNPRCFRDEVLPLGAGASRLSFREAGLQFRGPGRKLCTQMRFWSSN